MKDVNEDRENLKFSLMANNTNRMQILIHDKNEFLNFFNGIKVTEFMESITTSVTIRKIKKVRKCEESPSYSFSKCVENYIIQVIIH